MGLQQFSELLRNTNRATKIKKYDGASFANVFIFPLDFNGLDSIH